MLGEHRLPTPATRGHWFSDECRAFQRQSSGLGDDRSDELFALTAAIALSTSG